MYSQTGGAEKQSQHSDLKVKRYFAAYPRAMWRVLSGSQVPDAKYCLKKRKRLGGADASTMFK